MGARRASSRAFLSLVVIGAIVGGVAAWSAYDGTSQVLSCLSASSPPVLWPSSPACPAPLALLSHSSLVLAVLPGFVVAVSVGLFASSLAGCFAEQYLHRRVLARLVVETSTQPSPEGPSAASWPKRLVVVEAEAATAYCVGLIKPRVVVSTGLLGLLRGDRLAAVLAHEASHERRRDPLRASLAKSLARGLFFVPILRYLCEATLVEEELVADQQAIASAGRSNLAAALFMLLDQPAPASRRRAGGPSLPTTAAGATGRRCLDRRLEALETGKAPRLRSPVWPLLTSAALLAALAVTASTMPHYSPARILPPPSVAGARALPLPVVLAPNLPQRTPSRP